MPLIPRLREISWINWPTYLVAGRPLCTTFTCHYFFPATVPHHSPLQFFLLHMHLHNHPKLSFHIGFNIVYCIYGEAELVYSLD